MPDDFSNNEPGKFWKIVALSFSGLMLFLLSLPIQSLEFRLGQGDFDIKASISPIFNGNLSLDIDTFSLVETHHQIRDSQLYYQFNFDYFESGFINQLTDFASLPVSTPFPVIGIGIDDLIDQYSNVPVPADYRVQGMNLDIAFGYDLITTQKGFLGAGINTGLTFPTMKTRNLGSDANLVMDILETTRTEIKTWKLGPVVQFGWRPNDAVSLNGKLIWNYQTGSLDNDLLGSGINIDGSYTHFALGAELSPHSLMPTHSWLKNWFLSAGYTQSDWEYDKANVNILSGGISFPRLLDMDFTHNNLYLGLGYDF